MTAKQQTPGAATAAAPDPRTDPWASDAGLGQRRLDLLSLVPLAAIVALVALVGALVWAVHRADAERAATKLATDALWVEQTLRFQMAVDEDMLVRLALDQASGAAPQMLAARARVHVGANPEVLSVVWRDAAGRVVAAVPGLGAPDDPEVAAAILRGGLVSTRPVYGAPRDGRVTFGLRPADGGGIVTATTSLPTMLERHIPWWIAEQYAVRLTQGETVLAQRARRATHADSPDHAISFDPPLRGAALQIAAYDRPPVFANALMLAGIAALALFAILALAVLWRSARQRRLAEMRLRAEAAFRRSMEDSLTVGLRAKDHAGRVLYVNAAFCALVGLRPEDLVGHTPPMPYWSPDRMAETLARQDLLRAGNTAPQAFETRFRHRDGRMIDVQVYDAPLIDAQGRHRGWMGSVIDITEAKSAARLARAQDESLARTGRLVTLGEMASTLAHELNQPLGAIASYAAGGLNLIGSGNATPALLTQAMDRIALQARRAGLIIRRIQDFVKKREPQMGDLALDEVVADTVGFLAAAARESGVGIATDLAPGLRVAADRILIEQVLINLIRNGIEAMAEAGRTGEVLAVRLRPGAEAGTVEVEVEDRGAGIPEALRDRLFDPFSSTKPQGMGMGLNICRTIVEMHRGRLTHRAAADGGTVFTVTLPLAAGLGDSGVSGDDEAAA